MKNVFPSPAYAPLLERPPRWSRPWWMRLGLCVALTALYWPVFVGLFPHLGLGTVIFLIVPTMLAVTSLGFAGGMAILAFAMLCHVSAVAAVGLDPVALMLDQGGLGRSLAMAAMLALIARTSDLSARLRRHKTQLENRVELRTKNLEVVNRRLRGEIHRREQAETEAAELTRQMLHAQKLEGLGVLAGGVAHDFNNLLASMMGNLELARARMDPDHPASANIDRAERSAIRAAELTEQLLTYSGRAIPDIAPLEMGPLVSDLCDLLEISISKRATLVVTVQPDAGFVEADGGQIRQVIMNLVTNASDALGDQDGVVRVEVDRFEVDAEWLLAANPGGPLKPGTVVRIQVQDNGCGMEAETISRVWDPFFTTKFTGRGLGLAATLGIVRSHGGAVHVDSTLGEGTSFTLCLPWSPVQAVPVPTPTPTPTRLPARLAQGGQALVVDDEPSVRELMALLLTDLGFEVTQAEDGVEGLEHAQRLGDRLSLVLLDLTMPRMDGAETLSRLRDLGIQAPVIVMSGWSDAETQTRLGTLRPNARLQKPFSMRELEQTLAGLEESPPTPLELRAPR